MPLGLGLRPGFSGGVAPGSAPNPNLLLWSEEFDRAVWAGALGVAANSVADPLGGSTADRVSLPSGGQHVQTTAIAATTGAGVFLGVTLAPGLVRLSASGVFDGVTYVYSEWLASPGGQDINLSIYRSGGFITAGLSDLSDLGDLLIIDRWGAKLEAPNLTTYVKREGT